MAIERNFRELRAMEDIQLKSAALINAVFTHVAAGAAKTAIIAAVQKAEREACVAIMVST